MLVIFKIGKLRTGYLAVSFALLLFAAAFEGFSFGLIVPFLKQAAGMGFYEGWRTLPVAGPVLKFLHFERLAGRFGWLLLIIVMAVFVRQAATYASQALYGFVTLSLEKELRITGYKKLLRYGCSFFDTTSKGKIHNVLMRFTQEVSLFLGALFFTWQNIFFSIVYIFVLYQVSPQLCLISFIVAPLFYLSLRGFIRMVHRLYRDILKNEQAGHALSLDVFSNIKLIKALGREPLEAEAFEKLERMRARDRVLANTVQCLTGTLHEVLMALGIAVMIWISFTYYFKNDPAFLIKLIVSLMLFRRALSTVNSLIGNTPLVLKHYPFVNELQRMFDEKDKDIVSQGRISLRSIERGIEYDRVSMRYAGAEILKETTCVLPAGRFTAIVGASGAGKTTLVELLPRFYEFQKGDIRIDGTSIRDYDLASLRGKMGFVSQETLVLNDSILNNILFARPESSRQEVLEAARKAYVLEFADRLEQGIDTTVGDRGVKLSGGELQRLSIARVILRNPMILILDEATSALDSVSEQLIQEALDHLAQGRTTIAIAHRLSTIRNADWILVMDQGRIAEQGKLEDLLNQKGLFYRYWQAQHFE